MQYIVTGYGKNIQDFCCSVEETPELAFEKADEFKENGYHDISITGAIVREDDEWTTNYNELHYLLSKYTSYKEFKDNIDSYIWKFIKKHDLCDYVEDYYKVSAIDVICIPDYIKVPVDTKTYDGLLKAAKENQISVAELISRMIKRVF